jgi:hypothetical protein
MKLLNKEDRFFKFFKSSADSTSWYVTLLQGLSQSQNRPELAGSLEKLTVANQQTSQARSLPMTTGAYHWSLTSTR